MKTTVLWKLTLCAHFKNQVNHLPTLCNIFTLYRLVITSCLTLCNPMDCSPPGSSVHGSSQARTLEWVIIFFSRGSF